ncbi:hypothetical protein HELRODRAFT_167916 [Helobdella robusta]|uniref:Transmembrane protein 98 n=1 Tax=Helobdella robusta TaxID=6412 RepID=T1EZY4_HELRO|nr:hypothetical protein HELRODRAFT_167916 [Helobdella robusta]ESO10068.1 hypothetical protein HELRODRAFT_167916 [Helobdella robusta]
MNPTSIVAISILSAIFFGALIALIIILRKKLCKPFNDIVGYYQHENSQMENLVENMETCCNENNNEVELGEVNEVMDPNDKIYSNEEWASGAIDLVPHCLGILKIAHLLASKIIPITVQQGKLQNPETLTDLVSIAKRIGSRVDDVVQSMYPPLDPRLFEARCSSLVLSVNHLVMLAKSSCQLLNVLDWVDQLLADLEEHLKVMNEFSLVYEQSLKTIKNNCDEKDSTRAKSQNGVNSPDFVSITNAAHYNKLIGLTLSTNCGNGSQTSCTTSVNKDDDELLETSLNI